MSQPVFSPLEAPTSDPFPAQALHACQVLAHLLQRVPRPESVQLFTAEHWSAPWLQIHLYPDPDDAQLSAYQQAFGGLVTRSRRRDGEARAVVYSELATEVERVRVQVWNVNESPSVMPAPRSPEPRSPEPIADPPAEAVESADVSDTRCSDPLGSEPVDASGPAQVALPAQESEAADRSEPPVAPVDAS
ncbi:hypothetical protein [Streptacidiphilus anmyonensis]|uniref:hypothetical protein n=1 Tax=Streptacidiphilus anmyonensis TaxID=405782 RepID=UPI0005A7A382|nr:hypothetical protein [Streptacidiphilus anmyonensis]